MTLSRDVPHAYANRIGRRHAAAAYRVTSIGSCRVVGPLRRAEAEMGFELNQSGIYGYCHSSAEAVQQLRVLQGDLELPPHLLPVLSPNKADNPPMERTHIPSDLYFVELCSAKVLSVDGICIQLNYFTRHFESFFADRERARTFWRAVRENDVDKRKSVLNYGPERLPADRYLLENVRLEMSAQVALEADIEFIRSNVPDVLFVTHFNARRHDGQFLATRQAYLEMALAALRRCGARFFDPSDYVEAFGQDEALKGCDGSLSHYSCSFEDYLSQNWLARYIQPQIELRSRQLLTNKNSAAPQQQCVAAG